MSRSIRSLKNPREIIYNALMILFGVAGWAVLGLSVLAAMNAQSGGAQLGPLFVYAVVFLVYRWVGALFFRAYAFGNMILIGPKQFPALHEMVVRASQAIGLARPPRAFLYNSQGIFNAFARRLLGGRYVFLTSALVEASSDAQVRFVIGHEIGHHAAGHLNPWMNAVKLPGHLVPFLGPAYSRSREYTCDRIGAFLSEDVAASCGALQMLGCGCRRLNDAMSCEAFIEQERMVPVVFGFLSEIMRSHPRLTRRVKAIAAVGGRSAGIAPG